MIWAAIIAGVASLIAGGLNYASNESAKNEAKNLAERQRSDELRQQDLVNKQNQQQLSLAKNRQAFDVYNTNRQYDLAQQQSNKSTVKELADYYVERANSSPLFKQQLLSLWK